MYKPPAALSPSSKQTPPQAPNKPTWRNRFQRIRSQGRSAALVATGVLIAFLVLFAYNALQPPQPRLTVRDLDEAVAQALASMTPPPPAAVMVYEIIRPSLVQVHTRVLRTDGKTEGGRGTGVILDENGAILTSLHVVQSAVEIKVVFADGTESEASVMAKVPENDMAVLRPRLLPDQLIPATLGNPRALQVGDEAIVVGHPFGISNSLTAGVISGLNRTFKPPNSEQALERLIQFDAAVNPGNSGGPLLNRAGEVVGIVTGLVNPTDQDVFVGVGFAVPIDLAAAAAGSPPY